MKKQQYKYIVMLLVKYNNIWQKILVYNDTNWHSIIAIYDDIEHLHNFDKDKDYIVELYSMDTKNVDNTYLDKCKAWDAYRQVWY